MALSRFLQQKSSFNPLVICVTLLIVLLVVGITLVMPEQVNMLLNMVKSSIFKNFSWFYILGFSIFFILFVDLIHQQFWQYQVRHE